MQSSDSQKFATAAFDTLRSEAAAVFAASPEPSFAYGLQVFFPAASVLLPSDVVTVAAPLPSVIAPAGVTVLPL